MYTINISYPFFYAMARQAKADFPTASMESTYQEDAWFRLWMASLCDNIITAPNGVTIRRRDDVELDFPAQGGFIALMRSVSAAYQQWLGNSKED